MTIKILPLIGRLCFLILIPLVSLIHIYSNRFRPGVHDIKTFADQIIPFNKYFAVPYQFMVIFITLVLIYLAIVDYKYYFGLLASVIIGMFICFIIFFFYPTTVPRPIIQGNDFFTKMVLNIYSGDNPYNCFPSIHVLSAYLPMLFVFKYNKSFLMKGFTLIGCVSITLSTMFIKQHYILDALASIIMGTLLFLVFSNKSIWERRPFKAAIDFLIPFKLRNDIHS